MIPEFDFAGQAIKPGLSVIEASAGTGKTHAISHLVPRLLLDGSAGSLEEILVVTFTNDAARELANRIRRVLEKLHAPPDPDEPSKDEGIYRLREKFGSENIQKVIGRALLDLDLLGVSTIHSFCQKVLQTEGTLCGLPVIPELLANATEIPERVLRDYWESHVAGEELAAAIASAMNWKLSEDLAFLRTALPLEKAVPVPEVDDLEPLSAQMEALKQQLTPKLCQELLDIFALVTKWTKDAEPDATRKRVVAALYESKSATCPGFLEAVVLVAEAPDWIHGNSCRRQAAEAKECQAVKISVEIKAILEKIRWSFRNSCLLEIRKNVARSLASGRQITYDGLIETLRNALRGGQAEILAQRLRARYRVALIDESQDTDDRQFEIFRSIFVGLPDEPPLDSHRLVLIGDPKQAIYAFRGADVNTYLEAKQLAGGGIFSLTKTFRSPEPLVRATNALFSRDRSLLKEGLEFLPATSGLKDDCWLQDGESAPARMECWIVPDEDGEKYSSNAKRNKLISTTVASEIVRLLKRATITKSDGSSRRVTPGDFAILVSDGWQAAAMSEALLARGVPAVRAGSDDIMASEEAAEVLMLLHAMQEPRRSGLRWAALATRMLGITSAELRKAADQMDDAAWVEKFQHWQEVWVRQGVAAAMAEMDESEQVTIRLATQELGERRVTNFRQVTDLLEAASHQLGRDPGRLLRWLKQEIAGAENRSEVDERQLQIESDASAAKLVTMHSAKGLQYPLVFCPFLWPSKKPQGIQKLTVKGDDPRLVDLKLAEGDAAEADLIRSNLEDRLRLAYVAVTRAQVKVWLYGGANCGKASCVSALDWLLREEPVADVSTLKGKGYGQRHTAGLEALTSAAGAGDVIRWGPPPPGCETSWVEKQTMDSVELKSLPVPAIPEPWGMTSFSALTREKDPHAGKGGDLSAVPLDALAEADPPVRETPNTFLDAAGGQLVGTAVHDWIETWDFTTIHEQALTDHFGKYPSLGKDGLFVGQVAGMLEELREARLPGLDCSMADASPHAASSEWHFQLPIHATLDAARLAATFARHGQENYARQVAALPAESLTGYLHGFLDRIVFYEGAWGVIDWKTNRLGPTTSAYTRSALQRCAESSHYLLQTHLYLVALRRYLGPTAPIVGAWLVFLRGVASGQEDGILHIAPSEDLMRDLDALFAKPSHSAVP